MKKNKIHKNIDILSYIYYIENMKTEFTVSEIAKITNLHTSTIIKHAENQGIPKFGDKKTSPYRCGKEFLEFLKNNIKSRQKK